MVKGSGRRCQQAIRDWWQSLQGIETITAAREGQWATDHRGRPGAASEIWMRA